MNHNTWDSIRLSEPEEPSNWELYHENSKQNPWYRVAFTPEELAERLPGIHLSLPAQTEFSRRIDPSGLIGDFPLGQAFLQRHSCRDFVPDNIRFEELSCILDAGFGSNRRAARPRPLRSAPSAGSLFPLEAYFYTSKCQGLPNGLFHYDVERETVQLLRKGFFENALSEAMVQSELAHEASVFLFLTGIFDRTTLKYGERGYRMILIEAGHVAQNINLAAAALGLGCLNICAFYDRKAEDILGIDGVNHSVLYMIALGKEKSNHPAS